MHEPIRKEIEIEEKLLASGGKRSGIDRLSWSEKRVKLFFL
jgi:hypothetical protein